MTDKEWFERIDRVAAKYNNERMHTDFQEEEVLKFVEYFHKLYGRPYNKPAPRHRNEPHKVGS
jgi:hypothetical protein